MVKAIATTCTKIIKHKHSHGTYHSNGKNPFIISVSDWSTGDGGQWIVFAIQCKIIVI